MQTEVIEVMGMREEDKEVRLGSDSCGEVGKD